MATKIRYLTPEELRVADMFELLRQFKHGDRPFEQGQIIRVADTPERPRTAGDIQLCNFLNQGLQDFGLATLERNEQAVPA
jgi:hypothetical protein